MKIKNKCDYIHILKAKILFEYVKYINILETSIYCKKRFVYGM